MRLRDLKRSAKWQLKYSSKEEREGHNSVNDWIRIVVLTAFVVATGGAHSQDTQGRKSAPKGLQRNWTTHAEYSKMDDVTEYSISTPSIDSGALLVVRCKSAELEIFVSTGDLVEPEHGGSGRVKFDNGEPETDGWSISTNSRAMFSYSPEKMLPELLTAQRMLFEFTPFEKRPRTVTFRVGGLKQVMTQRILLTCGPLEPGTGADQEGAKALVTISERLHDLNAHLSETSMKQLETALDCRAAIVDKHNREYLEEPWKVDVSNRIEISSERAADARACADSRGKLLP